MSGGSAGRGHLGKAPVPATTTIVRTASPSGEWLLTRPVSFGLRPIGPAAAAMLWAAPHDSTVGDELLEDCRHAKPTVSHMANLQAPSLLQLEHIDAFNAGAQYNAQLLTTALEAVPGIAIPQTQDDNTFTSTTPDDSP